MAILADIGQASLIECIPDGIMPGAAWVATIFGSNHAGVTNNNNYLVVGAYFNTQFSAVLEHFPSSWSYCPAEE